MAVKLRLKRMGAKKQPFYRIVAADSRAKRDGRFIEVVGTYNPLTDPAEIKSLEKRMIMNSLNVLFKRGVYGTYLYAHDPLLRHSLTSLFEKAGFTLLKEEK